MATAAAQLRLSVVARQNSTSNYTDKQNPRISNLPFPCSAPQNQLPFSPSLSLLHSKNQSKPQLSNAGGNGSSGAGSFGGSSGGGGGGNWSGGGDSSSFNDASSSAAGFGVLGLFLNGWRSRVAADPQFPFKVLMEELVGVSACVLGDMASRPNFGLNELDFVFSTLVVGSILNFTLMYLLAPTAAATSPSLPAIFANCPTSHMFESGAYSLMHRLGTFVYKGTIFAAVGFAAGLVGTALSNGLISMRKKMDPNFETPNKPPPTILNALTWAIHMGVSSNLRYQTLNGIEFLLARVASPLVFKSSVVVLRCLNNVVGGMSFVILARLTGAQSVDQPIPVAVDVGSVAPEKEKLLDGGDDLQNNQSTYNWDQEKLLDGGDDLQNNQSTYKFGEILDVRVSGRFYPLMLTKPNANSCLNPPLGVLKIIEG